MNAKKKKGFTLVELLVVISIIALLVAILLPALGKARRQAQRIYCMANIKSQHAIQMEYALDNEGKFAIHNEFYANMAKGGLVSPWENAYDFPHLFSQMKSYMEDPYVMACPLLRKLGYAHDDPYYNEYGGLGWGAALDGINGDGIISGYCWFANHKFGAFAINSGELYEYDFDIVERYDNRLIIRKEPPWPEKMSDCKSNTAFIAHSIIHRGSGYFVEESHGSIEAYVSDYETTATDNPVGYADGHVEIHTKDQWLPRAKNPLG